jgi:GTP-binding protein EngB required for normal cell division
MGFLFSKKSRVIKEHEFFEIEKEEKNEKLGLKIHVCGNNIKKKDVIENLFTGKKITDKTYINRAKREFMTDQFYWIAKLYEKFNNNTINDIMKDIKADRDINKPFIKQQIILCFISEENKNILSSFNSIINDVYVPLIIIVSEDRIEPFGNIDQRRITNIAYRNIGAESLNSRIISALWNCDCYYNEKGNKICRYTPDNIFKSLEINLSFHSVNILLTGKSRAGKSTFINFLSNKLVALESDERVSVTQNLTEYYIYLSNDNNSEKIAIKLIDTPGVIPNNTEKTKEDLEKLIKNEDRNMENQIHFILFFFMEGDSLEGINDIFNLLDKCGIPVLFIINKAFDDTDNGKTKDINSTISHLRKNNWNNLINKDNYIGINLVGNRRIPCFGVDEIFKRLYDIYQEKNKFSEVLIKNIKECERKYHIGVIKNQENISEDLSKNIEIIQTELKEKIHMFKYLNINSIINSGKKPAIRCKNVINSLRNISNEVHKIDNIDIPAISFFQAFMVKEIGEIFGYDTKEMNYGLKLYLNQIKKDFDKGNMSLQKQEQENIIKTIDLNSKIIEGQIQKELDKPNKDFIINLSKLFMTIKDDSKKNNTNNLSDDEINRKITNEICLCCMTYLEEQLTKTNGLIFWSHYYEICSQILKGFEKYSRMDPNKWVKKEMIIIDK